MGEYVKLNDQIIKLGTCEDLYYARRDQIKDNLPLMSKVDGNDEPVGYLDPKNGYRYRFPFPDEDEQKLGTYEKFDRGLLVGVPYDILEGVEHDRIIQGVSCHGAYNVNQSLKCPADPGFVVSCSPRTELAPVEIVQQKQVDGQLWTVCRCGWCHAKFRLNQDHAEKLCAAIREYNNNEYGQEIIKRVLAGYEKSE